LLLSRRLAAPLGLLVPLLIAAFLRFYRLSATGQNLYYAAAVRSMLDSWHNFFFVSFDPGGWLMIDKPPLGLWLETLPVHLFGFHYWVLALPQALAGCAAVLVLNLLVRRQRGALVGAIAAATLAVSPASVASARNNSFDTVTMLLVLLAAVALIGAKQRGRRSWLVACAVLLGLAFNVKMAEAFLPIPAFALYYLYRTTRSRRRLLGDGLLFGGVLVAVSLAWVTAVGLTPPGDRPTVYNGDGNSIWSLTFEYNGVLRFLGQHHQERLRGEPAPSDSATALLNAGANPPAKSPFRLFVGRLGEQIGWLLLFALVGFGAAIRRAMRDGSDRDLLWAAWFALGAAYFSLAAVMEPQYLETIAAPTAVLFASGALAVAGWLSTRPRLGLLAVGAQLAYVLALATRGGEHLVPVVVMVALAVACTLLSAAPARTWRSTPLAGGALAAALLAGLAGPEVWSLATAAEPAVGSATRYPVGGPAAIRDYPPAPGGDAPARRSIAADPVLSLLVSGTPTPGILVATERALYGDAARYILLTNRPVLTLDTFQGDELAATKQLSSLVAAGKLRFFQLPLGGPWDGDGPPRTLVRRPLP
jgi:4-amino-4-deoxy-L-arabinose transferase-like glycosyltransferase